MRDRLEMGVLSVEEDLVLKAAMAVTNTALVIRNRRSEARDMDRVAMEAWDQQPILRMIIETHYSAEQRRGFRSRQTKTWAMDNRLPMTKGSWDPNPEAMEAGQAMKHMEIGD